MVWLFPQLNPCWGTSLNTRVLWIWTLSASALEHLVASGGSVLKAVEPLRGKPSWRKVRRAWVWYSGHDCGCLLCIWRCNVTSPCNLIPVPAPTLDCQTPNFSIKILFLSNIWPQRWETSLMLLPRKMHGFCIWSLWIQGVEQFTWDHRLIILVILTENNIF